MQVVSKQVPVTVYIRTLNEERCIRLVLDAVKDLTDDIILVDSGSTDRTIEIAQQYGARVVHQKWLGYGSQKRVGEENARYDWVLDLDADEIVSHEMADEIRKVFEAGPPKPIAYRIRQTQVFPSGFFHPDMATSLRMKFYNRTKIRMPESAVWDQFDLPKGEKAPVLDGALWHFGFNTFSSLSRKQESATTHYMKGISKKSLRSLSYRILFCFPVYFFKKLLLQGGWRGGMEGFIFSFVCAYNNWMKNVKLYERDYMEAATPEAALEKAGHRFSKEEESQQAAQKNAA